MELTNAEKDTADAAELFLSAHKKLVDAINSENDYDFKMAKSTRQKAFSRLLAALGEEFSEKTGLQSY
jgi:hypothetical protein